MLRLYSAVRKWSRATATILKKEITKRKLANASRANLIVAADYAYNFHGKEYTGKNVFLVELLKGERSFYRNDAEKFLNKLKTQEEIYVNPENPGESVMFCEGKGLYVVMIVMGFVSLLAGLINYIS